MTTYQAWEYEHWMIWMRKAGYAFTRRESRDPAVRLAESRDHTTILSYADGHPWDRVVLGGLVFDR